MATWRYINTPVIDNQYFGTFRGHTQIRNAIESGNLPYKEITMKAGERLDIIAGAEYGDSSYWWIIAAASEIGWGLQIPEGTILRIPDLQATIRLYS